MELQNNNYTEIFSKIDKFHKLNRNLITYTFGFNLYKDIKIFKHTSNKRLFKALLQLNPTNQFYSDPTKLKYLIHQIPCKGSIIYNLFALYYDKQMNIPIIAYTNNEKIYLIELKTYKEVSKLLLHSKMVICINHINCKNVDYLISCDVSNKVFIWNLHTFKSIFSIDKPYSNGYFLSCLLMNCNDSLFAILSNYSFEPMSVYNIENPDKPPLQINTTGVTFYLNGWSDKYNKQFYIINCGIQNVKLYNFITGKLIRTYDDGIGCSPHYSAFIMEKESLHLIETEDIGVVRIWELDTGYLLHKLNTHIQALRGIINWDDNFLIVAGYESIVLLDTKNNLNTIIPDGNNHYRCSLFKFVHPIHGECLISGGIEGIKIRAISKNLNQELDL